MKKMPESGQLWTLKSKKDTEENYNTVLIVKIEDRIVYFSPTHYNVRSKVGPTAYSTSSYFPSSFPSNIPITSSAVLSSFPVVQPSSFNSVTLSTTTPFCTASPVYDNTGYYYNYQNTYGAFRRFHSTNTQRQVEKEDIDKFLTYFQRMETV